MSNFDAGSLYHTLLSVPNPNSEVQQRAYEYAKKQNDSAMFIKLLSLENLESEIDKKISQQSDAEVLVTWASKPNRTSKELQERFKKENRATLLGKLAERSDLPKELYLAFAQMQKPTLSLTILGNSAAPVEAKLEAAKYAINGLKSSSTTSSKVSRIFKGQDPKVIQIAISHNKAFGSLEALSALAAPEDSELMANRFKHLVDSGLDSLSEWHNTYSVKNLFTNLNPTGKQIVRKILKEQQDAGKLRYVSSTILDLLNAPDVDPLDLALQEVKESNNSDAIDTALNQIVQGSNRGILRAALNSAVQNPATKVATLILYHSDCEYKTLPLLVARLKGDVNGLATVLASHRDATLYDLVFLQNDKFSEKAVKDGVPTRELIAQLAKLGSTGALASSKVGKVAPEELIEHIPVNIALNYIPVYSSNYINKALSGNDNAWKYFENLIGDWSNPLPGLIETSLSFAKEEQA